MQKIQLQFFKKNKIIKFFLADQYNICTCKIYIPHKFLIVILR